MLTVLIVLGAPWVYLGSWLLMACKRSSRISHNPNTPSGVKSEAADSNAHSPNDTLYIPPSEAESPRQILDAALFF